jgi:hypothetical protein
VGRRRLNASWAITAHCEPSGAGRAQQSGPPLFEITEFRLGPSRLTLRAQPRRASPPIHDPPTQQADSPLKSYRIPHEEARSWLSIEWPSLSASFITLLLRCTCLICSKLAASRPQLLRSYSTEAQSETWRKKVRKRPWN